MLALLLVSLTLASSVLCSPPGNSNLQDLRARNIVSNGQIADTYDFIIVGGGVAGLVLASRLSEDANTTVLVLEAGDTGDAVASSIDIPGNAYYTSLLGSSYDWTYTTAQQPHANNRAISWPRGKVLGGSSAINGMYLVRPSQLEVDAWATLASPQDNGASAGAWQWNSFFPAMKKSETFTPPTSAIQGEANIAYNTANHGTSGPLDYSYPGYTFPLVGDWTTTLAGVGIPQSPDAYGGSNWGAFVATSCINPANWTRSYARSAYLDPLPPRANLDVLTTATATRIVFAADSPSNNLTASGVEWASASGAATSVVNVRKEVILAGGAVGSPQVLMLSGVGPSDVLQAAGVNVTVSLPGVGQHLQDHLSAAVVFETSAQTAESIHASNSATASSATFLSFINSATGYANASVLFDSASTFQQEVIAALNTSAATLVPSTDPTVIAGYKAIYQVVAENFLASPVGQIELLLSLTGSTTGGASIAVQAALQHPLSQGRLYITSSNPFTYPTIDPNYLSHSADLTLMREGLKLARKIGQTAPLSAACGTETAPGPSVSADTDWETWLAGQVGTEFHPAGTCAMLPLDQGGVVDQNLQVYGLANVRVADSSVYPAAFSAHLQAPTYGLAEQAAEIIRAHYNGVAPPGATASTTSSASAPSRSAGSTSSKNGASPLLNTNTNGLAALAALLTAATYFGIAL